VAYCLMTCLEQAVVPPVYETLEPDICNITLNHDVGFCIFFDIHWKLGYDFQRKCGTCGKLDVAELFKCPLASCYSSLS